MLLSPHPGAILHHKLCERSLVSSVGVRSEKNYILISCKTPHGASACTPSTSSEFSIERSARDARRATRHLRTLVSSVRGYIPKWAAGGKIIRDLRGKVGHGPENGQKGLREKRVARLWAWEGVMSKGAAGEGKEPLANE